MSTIYQAQFEVIDQEIHTADLEKELRQRITEDLLRLGYVPAGELTRPSFDEIDGKTWARASIPVKPAEAVAA